MPVYIYIYGPIYIYMYVCMYEDPIPCPLSSLCLCLHFRDLEVTAGGSGFVLAATALEDPVNGNLKYKIIKEAMLFTIDPYYGNLK